MHAPISASTNKSPFVSKYVVSGGWGVWWAPRAPWQWMGGPAGLLWLGSRPASLCLFGGGGEWVVYLLQRQPPSWRNKPSRIRTRGRRVGRVRWARATRQTSTDKGRGTLKSVGPWSRTFCDEPHCPTPEPVQPTAVVGTLSHLMLVRGTASGVSSSVRGAGIQGLES